MSLIFLAATFKYVTAVVIELFVRRVWHRTLARIRRTHSGGASTETSTIRSSPATRLPLEVVEIIMAYLTYDTRSLHACSLICYSWYIAAVPRLHHTLTIYTFSEDPKFLWPGPLRHVHTLGLLSLVKELRVHGNNDNRAGLSPKLLNRCTLPRFSALTNVRELKIEYLDIPNFMPRILQNFRHFLPTVRSLILREPRGSHRQIIYFLGLFQHLEDVGLNYDWSRVLEEQTDDLALIPPFIPPLRGWLIMTCFGGVSLLKDMIDLFGGIRFRYVGLYDVGGTQLLLDACAKTLETLVFDPNDPHGELFSLKGTTNF